MTTSDNGPVLVGFDGSDQAAAAVRWAAEEAAARGAALQVVRLFEPWWPVSGFPGATLVDFGFDTDGLHREAQDGLDVEVAEVRRLHPDLPVTSDLHTGPVVEHLEATAGKGAALLVLGANGVGHAGGDHLGSTAEALVRSPAVPTVLVRGEPSGRGRVVVGLDGSEQSTVAAEFAAGHAARRGAELECVHAWSDRPLNGIVATLFSAMGDRRPAVAAERLVDAQLSQVTATHPDVRVHRVHRDDRPADALLDAAAEADLLVVGTHGRGTVGQLAFGSVSRAVTHRAPCPVAVIPTTEADADD